MSTKIALNHKTTYRYERPIAVGPQTIRLRPAAHTRSRILAYSLKIEPAEHFINWQQDPSGNFIARIVIPERTRLFSFEVDLIAELPAVNPFDFFTEDYAQSFPFDYDPLLSAELAPYRRTPPAGPLLKQYLAQSGFRQESAQNTTDLIVAINQRVASDLRYLIRMEPGIQTTEETLEKGSGSCRDSAYLLVHLLRQLGFAARFVSGYLIQLRTDPHTAETLSTLHPEAPKGPENDFTDLHAWAEVYVPGAGWLGLDATSGLFVGEGHIPLAATPEPESAAPVSGATEACQTEFDFSMSVTRLASDHGPPELASGHESPDRSFQSQGSANHTSLSISASTPGENPPTALDEQSPGVQRSAGDGTLADAAIESELNRIVAIVDRDLESLDLRLTMGGEPTFVHYDNPDAPEWNLAALGDDKRILASRLNLRLMEAFAPGGVLYHGQGKWYPGEELPRWALGVFFRVNGRPVWRRPEYLASEAGSLSTESDAPGPAAPAKDHAAPAAEDAQTFLQELARQLGLPPAAILPAYEDSYYELWQAGGTFDPDGPEPEELRALFERTENTTAGFVLPVQANPAASRGANARRSTAKADAPEPDWLTCEWGFKRGAVYLIPGDSPVGYRLPLNRIPNDLPADYDFPPEKDPIAEKTEADAGDDAQHQKQGQSQSSTSNAADATMILDERIAARRSAPPAPPVDHVFHTAVNVEIRGGLLRVFLPPLKDIEAYYDLIASIEATAIACDRPIILEGYPPPVDPGLNRLMVTPDPGVIEVNVHPARSWEELKTTTRTLYRCARQERLIAEKFELDGRPMGTGGGNHITLGAESPAESPFLRRPDILRSMITYWQHHPSLSYLFSGLFIGPTSQAPRIDEARHEGLYDLELAFASFDAFHAKSEAKSGQNEKAAIQDSQLWLVDRLLRNVLVDLTGNTHRSEFCIDKLFPGENLSTRLGLVELRAFEMSRGPTGYLAMMALVRALVARFAKSAYHKDFIRMGTELHDRFMLPFYLWRDFALVIEDLNAHGYEFRLNEHFADAFEFRFPLYGVTEIDGVTIELRAAMEPWPVLGETNVGGGTSRPVDAALERLQVRAQGLDENARLLCCNGRVLPLQATGVPGEYVAGVRFKAWAPPNTLHPLSPVDSPLVFDLVDVDRKRSLGGCTYHVSHPGGRTYDTRPVNNVEAEARRQSRFERAGHSGGDLTELPILRTNPEYPATLDLRYRNR
ncbi:MAG: transglutaminase family protein [bacterium]|nr:transglutaminase family protein [bacterium]